MDLIRMAVAVGLRFCAAMHRVPSDIAAVDARATRLAHEAATLGALSATPRDGAAAAVADIAPWWKEHWFLLLAAIAMAVPGLVALARNYWSTEQGAAGPIILMTGLWLLHHEANGARAVHDRAARWLVPAGLLIMGACTVTASVTAKQWLQLLGIYLSLALVLYGVVGRRQWLRLRIPILYLAFVIPPPDNLALPLTHALKGLVASASIGLLAGLGYPAARDGVLLY
ncbi:MAG: exosortase/archaeosortase family protein, partial [Oxalobacteraceae bacterium]